MNNKDTSADILLVKMQDVKLAVALLWEEAREKLGTENKPMPVAPPEVEFASRSNKIAGWAWNNTHLVGFNTSYLIIMNSPDIVKTVQHELLHKIVGYIYPKAKQAHGREFRLLADFFCWEGAGETYHNYSAMKARVVKSSNKQAIRSAELLNSIM